MSHIVKHYIIILLHNALAFQVTEWFEVTVRFCEIKLFHLDQLCDYCCNHDNIHISSNAADHPARKVKNLWRQRPTWNFPDSHHAQLVLPHSSTHIMHHNAWLQGTVCTCHCNTPNSRGSMVITLYNIVQLDIRPSPRHMMCINNILYKMLYTSQNVDHLDDDPLASINCKFNSTVKYEHELTLSMSPLCEGWGPERKWHTSMRMWH